MNSAMPAAAHVQRLVVDAGPGEAYFVAPEKLLSGNPKQTAWVQHASADQRFSAGLWHSQVGKWRIRYTEDEYCRILEGCSILTSEDGRAVTVRPGDEFVIPRGFVGTWEVVQPTLKRFVIHDPGP
jgi:uncharacterized cupin superfamily protein